jgi:signal transduction histidine kinase
MNSESVSCPRCGESVDPLNRSCEFCGVSLALAALLAEREFNTGEVVGDDIPISPEILVPLLGNYLIEKDVLKPHELEIALQFQEKLSKDGQTRLIGQTLLDLGFISKETLDQAVTEQIIELHSALQRANAELENRVRERTRELENALSRLKELNQLKSNFIANISHELRTPLTHLRGYLELMIDLELGQLSAEQIKALEVMRKSEERLERLIEDLIQYSLVARGELDLQITKVDLYELMREILFEADQKCKKHGRILKINIPEFLPAIEIDYRKIVWVLSQLIDNAVKFTHEKGEIEINVIVDGNLINFSVSDTGIGIDQDKMDELFEPFHQLDGSSTRRYGGTGLGLSMVKQIIEAHNSEMLVKSTLGLGSCFEFSLRIPT